MSSPVGSRVHRQDAVLQVTGRAKYVSDMVRPGMLYAKVLWSGVPHAIILDLDVEPAREMDGVATVITADDIPNNRLGFTHKDQPVLVSDKVRYPGDPLAVVAAESQDIAEAALKRIEVDYKVLPTVMSIEEAMALDAPTLHGETNLATHIKIRNGDIEQGWAESDRIIEEKLSTQMVEHCSLEPHAALAEVDDLGKVILYSSVGRPYLIASDVAGILDLPMNRVRLVVPSVGGNFGGKNETSLEPWVCLLALKTARPVKLVYTREEEFQTSTVRHPYEISYRTGVKADGTLVARQVEIWSDTGAYVTWGESTLSKACIHAVGPYRVPHVKIDGYLVYTNKSPGGAMRGFGVTQLGFAYECHTDTIATELGMDPLEFRMKNLLEDGAELPTGQVLEKVSVKETVREAVKLAGWKEVEPA